MSLAGVPHPDRRRAQSSNLIQALALAAGRVDQHEEADREIRLDLLSRLQEQSRTMQAAEMGVINIRVLAAGALSGTEERHPLGSPPPAPIGSGADYRRDVERARRFEPLVREGHADSLIEAALRYVIVQRAVSTVLVGYSTLEFPYLCPVLLDSTDSLSRSKGDILLLSEALLPPQLRRSSPPRWRRGAAPARPQRQHRQNHKAPNAVSEWPSFSPCRVPSRSLERRLRELKR
jgi:hypothetical protein